MSEKIINELKDKHVAILGFGKEGKSTYRFIRKYLKDQWITILDKIDVSHDSLLEKDENVEIVSGEAYLKNLECYDVIVKAPGVILKDVYEESMKYKITSQLELLLEVYKENIIGITGTKGKSTTSSMIYEVLKDQGKDVYLLGNIGVPVFDMLDKYKEDTILVVEMSSHQLEFINVSPHIGIILNLFQDHLDHAGSLKHYHDNKMNMFLYQNDQDIAIYADDNAYLKERMEQGNYKGKLYDVRFDMEEGNVHSARCDGTNIFLGNDLLYTDGKRNLIGKHNLKNIMFVMTVAKLFNLDLEKARKTIQSFKGLKYRMECIGTFDDVTYYNDTIATIPEATMSAIDSLKLVDTLIFGGMDREIDYHGFIEYLKTCSVQHFICMPTTGFQLGKILKEETNKDIYFVRTLEEAYKIAKEYTKKGHICLLSPAAASYEFFKNFEEKGKCFETIVKQDMTS